MEKASVSQLKNGLSGYLRKVREGQTVYVYDRDELIARIERAGPPADDEWLASLVARGIVEPPKRPLSLERIVRQPAPFGGVLEALLEEREEERQIDWR